MQEPLRPFESLDWYREAQQGRDGEHPWLSRARSFSAVRVHINLFALGSVVLLAINLLRTPENVRADTWVVVWALLLLMHAVAAIIVSLLMQLIAGDDALRPASEVRWDPMRTWTLSAPAPDAQGPVIPVVEKEPAAEPPPAPAASGWRDAEPEVITPAPGERASWREAAAAAWLARRPKSGQDEDAPGTGAGPDAPASDDGPDDLLSGREPFTRHPL
jgi:hypothetical protein